jgi:hypothetical protein
MQKMYVFLPFIAFSHTHTHTHPPPFVALTAVTIIKSIVLWDVRMCSPVEVHWRFGGMYSSSYYSYILFQLLLIYAYNLYRTVSSHLFVDSVPMILGVLVFNTSLHFPAWPAGLHLVLPLCPLYLYVSVTMAVSGMVQLFILARISARP